MQTTLRMARTRPLRKIVDLISPGMLTYSLQTITVTYASDVTPMVLRPYLTSYVNLCWVIGQFIAAGVLRGFLNRDDQWAYRVPFAIQWVSREKFLSRLSKATFRTRECLPDTDIRNLFSSPSADLRFQIWPPIILVGVVLAPESPWWLVRHGRYDEARKALLSLTKAESGIPFDVDKQIAMIRATNELEKAMSEGTNYWDTFKGVDRRRTEITCMVWGNASQ